MYFPFLLSDNPLSQLNGLGYNEYELKGLQKQCLNIQSGVVSDQVGSGVMCLHGCTSTTVAGMDSLVPPLAVILLPASTGPRAERQKQLCAIYLRDVFSLSNRTSVEGFRRVSARFNSIYQQLSPTTLPRWRAFRLCFIPVGLLHSQNSFRSACN